VARWWCDPHDLAALEAQYGRSIDRTDPTEVFIVEQNHEPIGLIQRYSSADDPAWRRMLDSAGISDVCIGIDYLIGEEAMTGRGLGPDIIERFVEDTWGRYTNVSSIAVAIQQENRASWRAVEKSGFRRVWAGVIDSEHPSDAGPSYVYVRSRSARLPDPA